MRDKERERQRHRQREKQAPCREPDVGLDPGTQGSHPGLKAGAKLLSHPGVPPLENLIYIQQFSNSLMMPSCENLSTVSQIPIHMS